MLGQREGRIEILRTLTNQKKEMKKRKKKEIKKERKKKTVEYFHIVVHVTNSQTVINCPELRKQGVIQAKVEVGHRVWDAKLPNSKNIYKINKRAKTK